jgi:WD40 repeat protein
MIKYFTFALIILSGNLQALNKRLAPNTTEQRNKKSRQEETSRVSQNSWFSYKSEIERLNPQTTSQRHANLREKFVRKLHLATNKHTQAELILLRMLNKEEALLNAQATLDPININTDNDISSIAVSPNSLYIVAGHSDGTISTFINHNALEPQKQSRKIYRNYQASGKTVHNPQEEISSITSITISHDNKFYAVGHEDSTIVGIFNLANNEHIQDIQLEDEDYVTTLAFSPYEQARYTLLIGTINGTIKKWDNASGPNTTPFIDKNQHQAISNITFYTHAKKIAFLLGRNNICLYDINHDPQNLYRYQTMSNVHQLYGSCYDQDSLIFSTDQGMSRLTIKIILSPSSQVISQSISAQGFSRARDIDLLAPHTVSRNKDIAVSSTGNSVIRIYPYALTNNDEPDSGNEALFHEDEDHDNDEDYDSDEDPLADVTIDDFIL